jgi:hypothetical protein
MYDDPMDLGLDTDQALGLDDATWSTGVGDLSGADDLGVDEAMLTSEVGDPPEITPPVVSDGVDAAPTPAAPPMPGEITFGAQIGPYGQTNDSYQSDYYWSTEDSTYRDTHGREIDEWTGNAK